MTQTDVGSDLIGFAGAPLSNLVAGVGASIQYPTNAPQTVGWVKVANSSPFTIYVSQGQLLGQVEAFTADVFPIRSGQPLGILPVAGVGLIAPGSDVTVYTTWFLQHPPGSYPSALGSGAVNTQVSTFLASVEPLLGPGPIGVTEGPFNVTGYGSVRATLGELSGLGPVQFLFSWLQPGPFNAVRQIGVDAGDAITVILPNFTDTLNVRIINQNNVIAQPTMDLHAYLPALYTFADPSTHGVLAAGHVTALANTATETIFIGPSPGPAFLCVTISANGSFGWPVNLTADITGNNSYAATLFSQDKATTDPEPTSVNEMVMLAAVPMKLAITNNTGAARDITWGLTTDTFRAG